ncbi:MAG: pyridoxal-phosphate dependent enzyme [Dokdonella sp.]
MASIDAASQAAHLWADYRPTRLLELPALARAANVGRVFAKLENERPLGNFKVLGGMTAGLRALARVSDRVPQDTQSRRLICASDGNHGLAVAAAARRAGAQASIYLPHGVSRIRAARIESQGGEIVWIHGTYDDAVEAASSAASLGEGLLIADTTGDPHDAVVADVMAGYRPLARELETQWREDPRQRPSHVFVQAGVGGLAAAIADGLRDMLREPAGLVIVEPASAACVGHALALGYPARIEGDLRTCADMLSCGLASTPAVEVLLRHHARPITVDEPGLEDAVAVLRNGGGPDTTPSGAAGLAGLLHMAARAELRLQHRLDPESVVLLIITEGAADPSA